MFFGFVFSIAARLIKLPPVTAPGEILPFKNKIHSDHFPIELKSKETQLCFLRL